MSPLMAQSRHGLVRRTCPLSGVKRTSPFALHMSAFDPRNFQQRWVNIDCRNVSGDFRDLKREPTVARAQIDRVHARSQAHRSQDRRRIRPQRLPPPSSRHFGALKKARWVVRHTVPASLRVADATLRVAENVRFGSKATFRDFGLMSALPPKADMCGAVAYVCFEPEADIGAATL